MTVTTITISNPSGEGNLLNPDVIARLVGELQQADGDPAVTGIMLTGAGSVFCSGLDIPAIKAGGDPVEFATALAGLLKLVPTLSTPIVAAINGDAVASGASLVAIMDYAVCTPDARIGTREVSLGIWPMVAQVPLIQRLGARWAMENVGSGEPFTAERAREVGLVNEIVAPERLHEAAQAWLEKAARAGAVTAVGRPAFYRFAELGYDEALDASVELFAEMNRPAR
ncbi:enoyl-CoA hydratase/isomerase family protein [Herbiconiux sp. CPCC 203407]|uniref:Enoyl-CoA hydratase/isomerase family protein n=1 Tax=Herbiconiux oxytropis TaxID=2970915 RepID=A0AA41XCQ3_9MICO|nr:enoyl-CoA hydratase/isomerase family protein [Herbiconiux oxytropis]MCS5722926.1 enoyl-CoA hydratase/isomerase family protein [Herbiconiux oxytropis]MCS5725814.1 enoyl-CoA hydratase/isomerase family protein [Herbiconiux oxytropis]